MQHSGTLRECDAFKKPFVLYRAVEFPCIDSCARGGQQGATAKPYKQIHVE